MIRTLIGSLALLVLLPALQARDKPEKQTPEQQYQALVQEYNKARQDYMKAIREAKTPQDQQKAFQEKYPQPQKFIPRFLAIAEKNPKSPAAVDALVWVVSNSNSGPKSDPNSPRGKAIKCLRDEHVKSEKMANVCQVLGRAQDEESHELVEAVLAKNPHASAKAAACLALAQQTENELNLAREFKDQPAMAKRYEQFMGKEYVEKLVKTDPDKLSKKAQGYYERLLKDFADVPSGRGATMGKLAENRLEALRHPILVGKPAPEIEAEDIDGTKFKLSDYRGKVVMLDFWGHW